LRGIREILLATDLRNLIEETRKTLERVLKCKTVNFCMLDKETIKNFQKEHGKTVRKNNKQCNCTFDVVLPHEITMT